MLEATPLHWFSWDFSVKDQEQHIADIDISCWRDKGFVDIGNEKYRVYLERLLSGAFILQRDDKVLARAEKPGVFSSRFDIEHDGRKLTLRRRQLFSRSFLLADETGAVGTVSASSIFSRRMKIDLPETLPISVRVFIIWLAVILWRRDSNAAAG